MDIKEKGKSLPLSPGVYLMKDTLGNTIYVGKAKNLKQRVRSYFQDSKNHSQKVQKLVKNINDFEVIETDTEFEAFLLECKLIQDIKPFFNSRMKSPQTYPYIVIRKERGRHDIEITQEPQPFDDTDSLTFGPYTSKNAVEKALQAIKEHYRIDCSNPSNRKSACLNYSIGTCMGICLGEPAREQYEAVIDKIIHLLNGRDSSILMEMKRKMNLASESFDFETAAKYKENIDAIHFLLDRKKVITFATNPKNMVVIELLDDNNIKLFLIRGNKVLFSEKHSRLEPKQLTSIISIKVLSLFKKNEVTRSKQMNQTEMDQARIIYSYLKSNHSRYLMIPQIWLKSGNEGKLAEAVENWLTEGQFL
ncbi:excinuclease ABC subunit C [Mesobacillus persicus]|uniref:Excinuclease ABC subunit C n=1 Tax=Mesobacillus persicus TaxID=930146 RepID=A0A1H8IS12_9BACI|nr:GIY-YIG nuclease family protein [Mesobacillus persicus]SEN70895.1 excinuclease ABC subunit C [Mesobacillus persicus]